MNEAFGIIVALLLGAILGTHFARVDCIKERCRVPCGEKFVKVHQDGDDWTKWYCSCEEVP